MARKIVYKPRPGPRCFRCNHALVIRSGAEPAARCICLPCANASGLDYPVLPLAVTRRAAA